MIKKVAIPVNNGMLDGHFGHCKQFAIFDINNKEVIGESAIDAPPHEPGLLPKFLSEKGVTDIIAGGMGHKAITLFQENGVNVFVGAPQLSARNLIDGFLNNTIRFNANYCDH
ncbi:MAG: NifB/NifX family molybdenum-iron cluster-binding protein [Prolixibacteraceae bacterium]|jgi:predicted Fe-Mo cluster-binding NifX family protein|nr:NifB/NifX family molybdenum-iron cluster-binding protein [Prolixibacteraceae bacterium]